jgi:hypothetical protein
VAVAAAATWMDVGVAVVSTIGSATTSVDPDTVTEPWASAIDNRAATAAACVADATGPGERQTG